MQDGIYIDLSSFSGEYHPAPMQGKKQFKKEKEKERQRLHGT